MLLILTNVNPAKGVSTRKLSVAIMFWKPLFPHSTAMRIMIEIRYSTRPEHMASKILSALNNSFIRRNNLYIYIKAFPLVAHSQRVARI